jgi:hypothetical protein
MKKIKIDLNELIGTGLLVKKDTGVTFSVQTAGNFCLMPEEEGFFIPVGNDVDENNIFHSLQDDLWEYFREPNIIGEGAIHGISEENANFIDDLFQKKYASLRNLKVDRAMLNKSHEGWVHVEIMYDPVGQISVENSNSVDFPIKGVLIWRS